ncbi:single-stranded DNA-binding protein [Leucobacter sp. HY1908]
MAYGGYKIEVEGTLAADPEVSQGRDREVLNVRVAHSAKAKQGDQLVDTETTWFKGVKWQRGQSAQDLHNVAASLKKGDRVLVTGTAFAEAWQSRDGKSGVTNVIEIDQITPVLRWATAQVVKNERGGGGYAQGQGQSNWGQAQGQQGWGQAAAPAAPPAPAAPAAAAPAAPAAPAGGSFCGGFDDEEPF